MESANATFQNSGATWFRRFFVLIFSLLPFLVAAAKKRGRPAQPKEPKPPKPPKIPKAPKPPKDPNAPKAKPGPKPKKATEAQADGKQEKIDETFKKVKRKIDRFKGMSEEEVMKKTLPDLLEYNLDYVIVRLFVHLFYSGIKHCALLGMNLSL